MTESLEQKLTSQEVGLLKSLDSPAKIQAFLDATPYSPEERNRCPLNVIRDHQAHCLDGGMFAAAALRRIGFAPLLVDLFPEPGLDDDHILAIFKVEGCWGVVAKSNYIGLRYREPVYRSLRELVMSYFDVFYNIDGERTLRSYTRPVNLARFDHLGWEWSDAGADYIEKHLKGLTGRPVISQVQVDRLTRLDDDAYRAGMLVANPAGLYKPKK
jgi:hypothetical protein